MYLIAVIFPPLAVLMCGKPFQAIVNFILTLLFYFPGAIHAVAVVADYKQHQARRYDRWHQRDVTVTTHVNVVNYLPEQPPPRRAIPTRQQPPERDPLDFS